ncbi:MAG: hypothetical protein SD837_05525 [Candidatus Electrothrix scaldis]|nr:MAG: hypothetical protein SD837_05525 [Candidatus Electrothrix sp. GW3-3]
MKGLLLLILFIFVVPLVIGVLAGVGGKSKSDLVQLATTAGLLILFTFYLLFIEDKGTKKEETEKKPAAKTEQPANCNITCIQDDYPIYIQEPRTQQPVNREGQFCDPAWEQHSRY